MIERCRHLGERHDGFEQLRNAAAERCRSDTGNTWRPRRRSHTSRTSQLTWEANAARDFLRARQNEKTQAHRPQSVLLAVFGSRPVDDPNRTCTALDNLRANYADMVLVHGAVPNQANGSRLILARAWPSAQPSADACGRRARNRIACRRAAHVRTAL